MSKPKCDLCGEGDYPDDPVVAYGDNEQAHIECAQAEGWEDR